MANPCHRLAIDGVLTPLSLFFDMVHEVLYVFNISVFDRRVVYLVFLSWSEDGRTSPLSLHIDVQACWFSSLFPPCSSVESGKVDLVTDPHPSTLTNGGLTHCGSIIVFRGRQPPALDPMASHTKPIFVFLYGCGANSTCQLSPFFFFG